MHDIDKGTLRRRQVAARTAMPDSIRNESGRLIRDHVLEMPQVTSAGTIAAGQTFTLVPGPREVGIVELFRARMSRASVA